MNNIKTTRHSIIYNNKEVSFTLIRKKVKNINMRIKNDGNITISANSRVPYWYIEKFVLDRIEWIIARLSKVGQKKHLDIYNVNYISEDKIRYLGKDMILNINKDKKEFIDIKEDKLNIHTKTVLGIEKIFREELKQVVDSSINRYLNMINVSFYPEVKLRKMKARWGTCAIYKKSITINYYLIHHRKECIDYIVLHELLHFKYHNHDKKFYDALTKCMPNWKEYRKELNSYYFV